MSRRMYFTVHEPAQNETPVVVEVPHAGLTIPAPYLSTMRAPAHAIGRDADLFVDELYGEAPLVGATLLVAHISRYVVDLNRGEGDVDAEAIEGAPAHARASRGIVWRLTGDGDPVLTRRLTQRELGARLDAVYRPYHAALREALDRKVAKFGHAVLLAAHSMPSAGRGAGSPDEGRPRADVVPGSRGRTTADARYIDLVDAHAKSEGWSVRHDEPYRGGFSTHHYGRPHERVHAVQVELARRLYMDEIGLERRSDGGFATTRAWCTSLIAKLGEAAR